MEPKRNTDSSGLNVLKQKTTPKPDPEAFLMMQFSEGDTEAFESLVNRCQGGLIQFFTMLSGNRADGEELAQEVFIRLYRSSQNYRPTAKFKTYLYRVARNLWTDHLRRKSSRGNLVSLEALDASGQGLTQGAEKQPQVTMKGEDRALTVPSADFHKTREKCFS